MNETTAIEIAPERSLEPPQTQPKHSTAGELRVMEINSALAPAYAKAGTLEMTTTESEGITAPFPDEIVEKRPHDGLFYIPHIHVSDRLTRIFGPGQWTMLRRWERIEANNIYAEWVMIIRGVYIGESIGAAQYHPNNPKQNYSDALESTRGEAIRRIAGKYLACGSQVWDPSYCRRRNGTPAPKATTVQPPKVATKAITAPAKPHVETEATEEQRTKMVALLDPVRQEATQMFIDRGWILPNEGLEDVPLRHVPTTKGAMDRLTAVVMTFVDGDTAPQSSPEPEPEPWRAFPMPFGKHAGTLLGKLEKNYLYGLWANYTVEEEYNGRPKSPATIQKDTAFREMLDDAGRHYDFEKKD